MTRYVVDANIAAKWFLDEEHAVTARNLGNGAHELIAPDFIRIEVANVILKRHRGGGISRADSDAALTILPTMVRTQSSVPLIRNALALAIEHGRSIYDALYVALALQERCSLVTADRRLYNALQPALAHTMLWVADLPGASQ